MSTFSSQQRSLLLIVAFLVLPLIATAKFKNNLSREELYHLANNQNEIYIYCDKHRNKIAEFIDQISAFDEDYNSPIWELNRHLGNGFSIGRRDEIIEALAYAEKFLAKTHKALSNNQIEQLHTTLTSIIDEVLNGQLNVDVQALLDNLPTKDLSIDHDNIPFRNPTPILKIREKIYALRSAKFFEEVEFKDNVEFEGKAKFDQNVKIKEDATIGCDLTVGCNINMNESTSPSVGNIYKDGNSFIHNFGSVNTFIGEGAGNFTITGFGNTGSGAFALQASQNAFYNTATGLGALNSNQNGSVNTANGAISLVSNTTGSANTAVGFISMAGNISGNSNTAVGIAALINNNSGSNNVAIGADALDNSTGSNNIALGTNAGTNLTSGNNNVYIANNGSSTESGAIRIGTLGTQTMAFMQGIFGSTVSVGGLAVEVDSTGKLGTIVSTQARKHNINDMGNASDDVYKLRPVTFAFNDDITEAQQYGLIAEEVAAVFPSLVVFDNDGKPFAVRYQILPMLLLNEMQKQQSRIDALAERVAHLEQSTAA